MIKRLDHVSIVLLLMISLGCGKSVDYQARQALRKLADDAKGNVKEEIRVLEEKERVRVDLDSFDFSMEDSPGVKKALGRISYIVLCHEGTTHGKGFREQMYYGWVVHLEYKNNTWLILSREERQRSNKSNFDNGIFGVESINGKTANFLDFTVDPLYRVLHPELREVR